MAENKTKQTKVSAVKYIAALENEQRRKDGRELLTLMKQITGEPARMWGPSIIGFGKYHYRHDSGHEGDIMIAGFSPRKASLVVYLGEMQKQQALLGKLGKHKASKGCLYINKLDDVDRSVLRKLIEVSVARTRQQIK
jgi:Domain of unknown function (DU1801)